MAGIFVMFVYVVIFQEDAKFIFIFDSEEKARDFKFEPWRLFERRRTVKIELLDGAIAIQSEDGYAKLAQRGIYLIFREGCPNDPFAAAFDEEVARRFLAEHNGIGDAEQYYRMQWYPVGGKEGVEEI